MRDDPLPPGPAPTARCAGCRRRLPLRLRGVRAGEGGGGTGGTLRFGAAGAPPLFDPFYATDGETFRISRQIFEGLVGIEPGTANLQPALATDWQSSATA